MGTSNTMTIGTFLKIAPQLRANTSVLIRGNHGIGKSMLARQVAKKVQAELGLANYTVIDRRLSQITEGDIIGLPSTNGEVTRFNPPDWFKKACDEPCFLFLDELNRATPEVMQAAFQIVLDRELNGWKLHPQTRVFSAVNSAAAYTINEIDPALLDRFWVIDLNATVEDWLAWAKAEPLPSDVERKGMTQNVPDLVIDFIAHENKWLYPSKNAEGASVEASPRSWDRVGLQLASVGVIDTPEAPEFYYMTQGYVGTEAAISFQAFAKSVDNRVTGEEILNEYDKVLPKIKKLGQEKLNIAIDKLSEHVLANVKELNDKQGKNIKKFMALLPGELRLACWSKLTAAGTEKLELAKSVHKYCAELILEVFGVPMGEAGIGVVPQIPGIFKQQAK